MYVTNTTEFVAVCTRLEANDPDLVSLDLSGYIEFDVAKAYILLGALKQNSCLRKLVICKKNVYSFPLNIDVLYDIFNLFIRSKTLNHLLLSPWQIASSSQKHPMRLESNFDEAYSSYKLRSNDQFKRTIVYEIMAAVIEAMDQQLLGEILAQKTQKRARLKTPAYDAIRRRKFLPVERICEYAGIEVFMPRKFFAPQ